MSGWLWRSAPAAAAPTPAVAPAGPGKPLQLVSVDASGKFVLNEPALAALRSIRGPVGVATVGGRARQGKSMVLNQLIGPSAAGRGFSVSSAVTPHTKGIWVWSAPIPATDAAGKPYSLILMDSEGIDAVDQTGKYSASIFSLSILLSSLFIWNMMGPMDESALEKLAMVVELTKSIRVRAGDGRGGAAGPPEADLSDAMPSFLWLLRDFYLTLGGGGGPATADDYLEAALSDVPGDAGGKNGVRRAIRSLFPRRACVTLVRPASDEATLQNLASVPLTSLRPEFVEGLRGLTAQIFGLARPKRVAPGAPALTGHGLASLARAYVDALNGGAVPTIATAWEGVSEAECRRAADAAEAAYRAAWSASTPDAASALDAEHGRCLGAAAAAFDEVALGEGDVRSAADGRWRAAVGREFASHRAARLAAASAAVARALAAEGAAITAFASGAGATPDAVAARITAAAGLVPGLAGADEDEHPGSAYGKWAATTAATAARALVARAAAEADARAAAAQSAVAAAQAAAREAETRAAAAGAGAEGRAREADARVAAAEARAREAEARVAAAEARAREADARAAAAGGAAAAAAEARAAAAERAAAAANAEATAARAAVAAANADASSVRGRAERAEAALAAARAAAAAAPPPAPPAPVDAEFADAEAGVDVDPSSMSIPQLKAWLTEAGHEDVAWRLAGAKAKKAEYVAAANVVLGRR